MIWRLMFYILASYCFMTHRILFFDFMNYVAIFGILSQIFQISIIG